MQRRGLARKCAATSAGSAGDTRACPEVVAARGLRSVGRQGIPFEVLLGLGLGQRVGSRLLGEEGHLQQLVALIR